MNYPFCDGNQWIDLAPCFPKWADINEDLIVNQLDVEALKKLVR